MLIASSGGRILPGYLSNYGAIVARRAGWS